ICTEGTRLPEAGIWQGEGCTAHDARLATWVRIVVEEASVMVDAFAVGDPRFILADFRLLAIAVHSTASGAGIALLAAVVGQFTCANVGPCAVRTLLGLIAGVVFAALDGAGVAVFTVER